MARAIRDLHCYWVENFVPQCAAPACPVLVPVTAQLAMAGTLDGRRTNVSGHRQAQSHQGRSTSAMFQRFGSGDGPMPGPTVGSCSRVTAVVVACPADMRIGRFPRAGKISEGNCGTVGATDAPRSELYSDLDRGCGRSG